MSRAGGQDGNSLNLFPSGLSLPGGSAFAEASSFAKATADGAADREGEWLAGSLAGNASWNIEWWLVQSARAGHLRDATRATRRAGAFQVMPAISQVVLGAFLKSARRGMVPRAIRTRTMKYQISAKGHAKAQTRNKPTGP